MSYRALQFDAVAGDADGWADRLIEAGAISVDASDPFAGTPEEAPLYGEPGERGVDMWPISRLVALFPEGADGGAAIARAAAAMARPVPEFSTRVVADQDWVRATQAQFGPVQISATLWIVPTWHDAPNPSAVVLRLDPGLAFGTGSHPTTRLCLSWLESNLAPGESLLDYGCGSGILAIAAARLGAKPVFGTDIDPQAMIASAENALVNGVAATFVPLEEVPRGEFDCVVANILANPLVLLAPALAARVRDGGRIALSGILEGQTQTVLAAYAPWFNMRPVQTADGWVLLVGDRHSRSSR